MLAIIITIVSYAYNGVTSAYLLGNIDKFVDSYIEKLFGDTFSDYGYDYYNPWGEDYGAGDEWGNPGGDEWNYGEDYGGGGNGADGGISAEDQSVIDLVRESMLPGFPEFTIEEVLLFCAAEEELEWECFVFDDSEDPSYCIFAMGADRDFDSVFVEFMLHDDGTIDINNFYDGNRDEYGEDAIDLYGEWYEKILSKDEAATDA